MDRTIQSIIDRLNADSDEMRELERKRMSEVYVERYLDSPTHEWFRNLSMELGTVNYNFTFTEDDNRALTATYDFYLDCDRWFQIGYELEENGTATLKVYNKDRHNTWEGGDLTELWGFIIGAYGNPKTRESVTR